MTDRSPAPHAKVPAPAALVDALLDAAGLEGPWTVVEVASAGRVNTSTIVALPDGGRVVVRVYGWPFDGEPSFDRRAKEAWLHPRLRAAGVPVPEVLAVADDAGRQAALLEWVPGELLGTVAARDPDVDLTVAWREAGAALRRVHDLDLGLEGEGFVAAGAVVPFAEGSLAERVTGELGPFAERVAPEVGAGVVDAGRVRRVADGLLPVLAAAPIRLGHSDANAWNVLVAPDPDGVHRLAAWLDWELAWRADPAYDHVRATVQRFATIGPTPDSWWEGHGERPPEVRMEAYALHLLLWKAVERIDGLDSPETRLAWDELASVPTRLSRIEALLAG